MTNTPKLYLLLTILIFISLSCDSGVEPQNDKIDLSNYEWTVDTLMFDGAYQIYMTSIWGSDKNNVYVCGHSSPGIADLWKYNGEKWTIISQDNYVDKPNARAAVIEGSSERDIWIAGKYYNGNQNFSPFISHYTGSNWKVHKIPGIKEKVKCLHSTGLNEVYAGGDWGAVWYFDGSEWHKDILEFDVSAGTNCEVWSIIEFNNKMHLLVAATDLVNNNAKFWYLTGSIGNWEIKNVMIRNYQGGLWDFATLGLFKLKNDLYSYRPGIFKQTGSSWKRVFPELTNKMAISDVEPIGEEQFIAIGEFSDVNFYDGNSLHPINQVPNSGVVYTTLEIVDDEIFIVGSMNTPPYSTAIYHGKPKE